MLCRGAAELFSSGCSDASKQTRTKVRRNSDKLKSRNKRQWLVVLRADGIVVHRVLSGSGGGDNAAAAPAAPTLSLAADKRIVVNLQTRRSCS